MPVQSAQVQVMNVALGALLCEPVPDLGDASVAKSGGLYKLLPLADLARQAVLCRQGWLCALEYVRLAPQPTPPCPDDQDPSCWPPPHPFPAIYQLPGDCLRVWSVNGLCLWLSDTVSWADRWQVLTQDTDLGSTHIIRARWGCGNLPVSYVRDCAWGALTPSLIDAVGYDLAARGCMNITGKGRLAVSLKQQAEEKFQIALGIDGTQEGGQEPWAPSIPQMIRNLSR